MLESKPLEGGSNIGVVGKWAAPTFLYVYALLPSYLGLKLYGEKINEERIYLSI
jgi:hypothetical protein